jgi:hypothetical protein
MPRPPPPKAKKDDPKSDPRAFAKTQPIEAVQTPPETSAVAGPPAKVILTPPAAPPKVIEKEESKPSPLAMSMMPPRDETGETKPPSSPRHSKRPSKIPSSFPIFDEGSLAHAFDALMSDAPSGVAGTHQVDLAPVRELFAELAANHMRHVRDFMIDVKWGEATRDWIEICVPAVVSLKRAADRLDLADLAVALDAFGVSLREVGTTGGRTIDGIPRENLLDAYHELATILPQAFHLDRDSSQREAVIVQALLLSIPDVRKVTIDKLHSAGLTSLQVLFDAKAREIAQVAGIPEALAQRIVERVEAYRDELRESKPQDARAAEREKLEKLTQQLKDQHDGYEEAARGWSADAKAKKRDLFRGREETWLAISLLLARFGEVERLQGIEKVPFEKRISQLTEYLADAADKYRVSEG